MRRYDQLGGRRLLVEILIVLAPEGETPAEECEEKHTASIDIGGWSTVLRLAYDLRSHIRWRAAKELHFLSVRDLRAETKINQLYVPLVVQHHIFKLDVAMRYTLVVEVAQSTDQLREYLARFIFLHLPIWLCFEETMR